MTASSIDFYKQELEAAIIEKLAQRQGLSLDEATGIFYRSSLSRQISSGEYGIENLSAGYLATDLVENEPELFFNHQEGETCN